MGRLPPSTARILRSGAASLLILTASAAPAAAEYLFMSPRAAKQNRVYWLDRYTGTIGACQFARDDASGPGRMLCFPPGAGARDMPSGDYDLLASNFGDEEWGVFRVNRATGEISLCLVDDKVEKVVCTRQAIAR